MDEKKNEKPMELKEKELDEEELDKVNGGVVAQQPFMGTVTSGILLARGDRPEQ